MSICHRSRSVLIIINCICHRSRRVFLTYETTESCLYPTDHQEFFFLMKLQNYVYMPQIAKSFDNSYVYMPQIAKSFSYLWSYRIMSICHRSRRVLLSYEATKYFHVSGVVAIEREYKYRDGKTRFFSFFRMIGKVENHPAQKRRNMSSVKKSVKYLYVMCSKIILFKVLIQMM